MESTSQLVGYDIRRAVTPTLLGAWDAARRDQYLLRPEVAYPYSIDPMVWPSRFQVGSINRDPVPPESGPFVLDPATANTHFQLFDLWDDLVKMLGPHRPTPEGDVGLAVGLVVPELYPDGSEVVADEWWRAIHGTPIVPPTPKPEWQRIGYDVANSGFTSSVSNCGFTAVERVPLRKRWASAINPFGLFETVDDAVAYRADSNVRVADDGPFFVFELFLAWSTVPPG